MPYGIKLGQVYVPADGSLGKLVVVDCDTYEPEGDVVVYDTIQKTLRLIDAFKLARVRYKLVEENS